MKDVGILTFHDTSNFGAILQAYATFKAVTSLGYSAEIIDYQNDNIRRREIPIERLRNSQSTKDTAKWVLRDHKEQKKYELLIGFLKNETALSDRNYTKSNFTEARKEYKTMLVGSDMLWCTRYTLSDYSYMLEGIEGCKKVSYATSVGYRWADEEDAAIISMLSSFDRIAVREKDTADYLGSRLRKLIDNVCDPTMLIGSSEWETLITSKIKTNEILIYMDDSDKHCENTADIIAKKSGMIVRKVGFQIWPFKNKSVVELYTIQAFLSAIYNASMIITASYHGLLFAIYFHIPFIYFNKDSSRMSTLADRLGIGYRDGNKYNVAEMKDIDWNEIDKNVENFRLESMSVLKGMLSE